MATRANAALRLATGAQSAKAAMMASLKAPDSVIERHLTQAHNKKASWIAENREYLRIAHQLEHGLGRANDHAVEDGLLRHSSGAKAGI